MVTDVVIMAGGYGERLWPASSDNLPKQFMAINNNISFLQDSIIRALKLMVLGKIIIITRKDIEKQCCEQCIELANKVSNIDRKKLLKDVVVLAEPCGKHTSAAIMTSALFLIKTTEIKRHTVLVMTSDHVIGPINSFINDCNTASVLASQGKFVCFAIPPTEPSTAYGYIKVSDKLSSSSNVYKISSFKEKPDAVTAKEYFESGDYFWNSGMFAFNIESFLEEMRICTEKIFYAYDDLLKGEKPLLTTYKGINVIQDWVALEKTYLKVPSIAIDKSIAEKTSNAVAVMSSFNWVDVGSWDTFSELCTNPLNAKVVEVDAKNNFVYSDIPVAICGVDDLIVVEKNNELLIIKKGASNLVREAVNKIKEE